MGNSYSNPAGMPGQGSNPSVVVGGNPLAADPSWMSSSSNSTPSTQSDPMDQIIMAILATYAGGHRKPNAEIMQYLNQILGQTKPLAQQEGAPATQLATGLAETQGAQDLINQTIRPANQNLPGWNVMGRPYQAQAMIQQQDQEQGARTRALDRWAQKHVRPLDQAAFEQDPKSFMRQHADDGVLSNPFTDHVKPPSFLTNPDDSQPSYMMTRLYDSIGGP